MIEAFLNDLRQNEQVMRLLGNPVHVIEDALNEVSQLRANQKVKDYVVFKIKDKDYGLFEVVDGQVKWKLPTGTMLSRRKDNLVDRPYRIKIVDDEIWILSLYRPIARFDLDFSFKGYFGVWGEFSDDDPDRYIYPRGFTVTDDRVYIAFESRHRVGCYDRQTGERLWIFGNGSPGNPEDGKLYNPYDVNVLPNGHVLIACYYGQPTGAIANNGMVVELNENGEYVKTHLAYRKNGYPWVNDVSHPVVLRVLQNPKTTETEVWIAYYDRDMIAVFEWDENEDKLIYKTVYSKTPGLNVGSIAIRDFVVDYQSEKLYASCDGPKVVACIDLNTSNLLGYVGDYRWEDYDGNPETPGGFSQVAGIAVTTDGRLLVADYNNNRVQQFPLDLITADKVTVEYEGELPAFKKIEYISDERFSLNTVSIRINPQLILERPLPKEVVICGIL